MTALNLKKIIVLMLTLVLSIGCFVLPADAVDLSKDTFVIEGNVYHDISADLSGNGWSWDAENFTLTLDGYNSSLIVFIPATMSSKTLEIVAKNDNTIYYNKDEVACPVNITKKFLDTPHQPFCYFCSKAFIIAALDIRNCKTHLSGGTINVKALGKSANAVCFDSEATIENTTLNCVATYRGVLGNLTVKNSIINIDSRHGYSTSNSMFDGCKITYKNSDINNTHRELITSGGNHTFKNCTFEIVYGDRPDDDERIWGAGFQGVARMEFDNTILKVKKGEHDHPDNSLVLFSLGYPEVDGNWLNIKNNSRFELDKCISQVFSAKQVNISDSIIMGEYSEKFVSAVELNITNSDIEVESKGDEQRELIQAHEINVKNSKIKAKTNSNLWAPNELISFPNEKKLTLVDAQLDLEGKVEKFGEKWSLEYTTPEKWIVILDGIQSDLSVNSSNLDLRHEKIVIKINENYTTPQNNTLKTTDKNTNSDTVTSDSSAVSQFQSSESLTQSTVQATGSEPSTTTIGNDQSPKNSNVGKIILIVVSSVIVLAAAGTTVFFIVRKKGVK